MFWTCRRAAVLDTARQLGSRGQAVFHFGAMSSSTISSLACLEMGPLTPRHCIPGRNSRGIPPHFGSGAIALIQKTMQTGMGRKPGGIPPCSVSTALQSKILASSARLGEIPNLKL